MKFEIKQNRSISELNKKIDNLCRLIKITEKKLNIEKINKINEKLNSIRETIEVLEKEKERIEKEEEEKKNILIKCWTEQVEANKKISKIIQELQEIEEKANLNSQLTNGIVKETEEINNKICEMTEKLNEIYISTKNKMEDTSTEFTKVVNSLREELNCIVAKFENISNEFRSIIDGVKCQVDDEKNKTIQEINKIVVKQNELSKKIEDSNIVVKQEEIAEELEKIKSEVKEATKKIHETNEKLRSIPEVRIIEEKELKNKFRSIFKKFCTVGVIVAISTGVLLNYKGIRKRIENICNFVYNSTTNLVWNVKGKISNFNYFLHSLFEQREKNVVGEKETPAVKVEKVKEKEDKMVTTLVVEVKEEPYEKKDIYNAKIKKSKIEKSSFERYYELFESITNTGEEEKAAIARKICEKMESLRGDKKKEEEIVRTIEETKKKYNINDSEMKELFFLYLVNSKF